MEDNTWEDGLKDMLQNYKPEGLVPDWNEFSDYLNVHNEISELEHDAAFDESLKESLSGFEAAAPASQWSRIESSLNLADQQFDDNIRQKIHQYQPQYNASSWNRLKRQLSGIGYLRTKLITFKVVEAAAVILFLLTVVKFGQMGKLPFETPLFENHHNGTQNQNVEMADNSAPSPSHSNSVQEADLSSTVTSSANAGNSGSENGTNLLENADHATTQNDIVESVKRSEPASRKDLPVRPITVASITPLSNDKNTEGYTDINVAIAAPDELNTDLAASASGKSFFKKLQVANFLGTLISPIRWSRDKSMPQFSYSKPQSKRYTEFGIVTQFDLNHLQIPEDRLLSKGKQIHFPQKGIPTSSIGGGFAFAVAHPKWAVESGMIYNAKNFRPGRNLMVGDLGSEDNSSITFDAMRLHMISVPLNFRYKFATKGMFKFYGIAAFGLNLIVQSDIDISIKYKFPSLSAGRNPNDDPNLQPIIRETKKISEHFRDGAPFSSKSYFSIGGGAGLEYAISANKKLFLQSAVQYQVPDLEFSNYNGKNIRAVSIQAGVRTPIGQ